MRTLVWLNFVRWEVAFGASHRLDGIRPGDPAFARPKAPNLPDNVQKSSLGLQPLATCLAMHR